MNTYTPVELEAIRSKIEAGLDDADHGRFVDDNNEQAYLDDKLARLRERMAALSIQPR
ncbi:MAG: hypothetical protein ABL907_08600 [Hyphomicrobium sp.]